MVDDCGSDRVVSSANEDSEIWEVKQSQHRDQSWGEEG